MRYLSSIWQTIAAFGVGFLWHIGYAIPNHRYTPSLLRASRRNMKYIVSLALLIILLVQLDAESRDFLQDIYGCALYSARRNKMLSLFLVSLSLGTLYTYL